jgi:excisionase family DNA binding protein
MTLGDISSTGADIRKLLNGLLPVSEAARRAGLPVQTVFTAVRRGKLQGVKVGWTMLVNMNDVQAFAKNRTGRNGD